MYLLQFAAVLGTVRTGVFAEGRFMGKILDLWMVDLEDFVHAKLPHLILVAIIAFILARLLRLITGRMIHIAERHAAGQERVSQVRTLASVIRATGIAIIGTLIVLQVMAAFGVNLSPLLASAGVAGVAVGLAAQSMVKDMLNGVMILIEDQFDVAMWFDWRASQARSRA